MVNKFLVVAFAVTTLFSAYGQEQPSNAATTMRSTGKPNIPGNFVFEFGFNQPFDRDSLFNLNFWGSRTLNIYYQYDIRLFQSKFSLVPGIGVSLERYKFSNLYTLAYTSDGTDEALALVPAYPAIPLSSLRKSMLITNFIDIPVELRFSTRPDDPVRSFKASIGGRIGYLYDAFTKIVYKEEGEKKIIKDKQNFNLTRFRYGTFVKIGAGNISAFAYYNLTPIFKEDEGPLPGKTDMQNFTVGISLSGF